MPTFSYFFCVGSVLLALLFVVDATLKKSAPMQVSEFVGLPKTYARKTSDGFLASTPAPAPDMSSDTVKAAAAVDAATEPERAPAIAPKIAPKKNRNIVVRQKQNESRHSFAWWRNDRSFGSRHFSEQF